MSNSDQNIAADVEPRVSYRSCITTIFIMLLIALLPIFACRLATAGQMSFGELPENYLNIFLLQEPGQEGIGVQRTRRIDIPGNETGCIRTSVRYYMVSGEGENLDSCSCDSSVSLENLPSGCQIPSTITDD